MPKRKKPKNLRIKRKISGSLSDLNSAGAEEPSYKIYVMTHTCQEQAHSPERSFLHGAKKKTQ